MRSKYPRILRPFLEGWIHGAPGKLYSACKAIDGFKGDGTFQLAMFRTIKYYYLNERQLYYQPVGSFDQLKEIGNYNYYLDTGGAPEWALDHVGVTFRMFESIYTVPEGRVQMPRSGESDKGLHCVAVVGWDDAEDSLIFQNSWGAGWGDRGIGYMPRAYFDKYCHEAWLLRRSIVGPVVAKFPRLNQIKSSREFAKVWMIRNVPWRHRFREGRQRLEWVLYETVTPEGQRAEIVDLRNGFGLRLGWAQVVHRRGERKDCSEISELFVWPAFRRAGYGRLLEAVLSQLSKQAGSGQQLIQLHESDDLQGVRSAGRAFAQSAGYKLRYGLYSKPNLKAVGTKEVN